MGDPASLLLFLDAQGIEEGVEEAIHKEGGQREIKSEECCGSELLDLRVGLINCLLNQPLLSRKLVGRPWTPLLFCEF